MVSGEARGLVSKTLIEVLRALTMSIFDTPNLGERVEEILIVAAIVVGQAEGRLMCASDIANYVGLPRATVIRKLRTVDMARMLGKTRQGNRACYLLGIEDLHFHDLRHEGVSRLFELGWTIPHAASVSGHRSWQSLKRYTHIRQRGDKYAGWKWVAMVGARLDEAPWPVCTSR